MYRTCTAFALVVVVIGLSSSVHAQTIPKQFQGKWCIFSSGFSWRTLQRPPCHGAPEYKIRAKGYTMYEDYRCTAIKVRPEPERRWGIKFRCTGKEINDDIWQLQSGEKRAQDFLFIRIAGDFCPEKEDIESDCDRGMVDVPGEERRIGPDWQ
jgi:hypothetical protein